MSKASPLPGQLILEGMAPPAEKPDLDELLPFYSVFHPEFFGLSEDEIFGMQDVSVADKLHASPGYLKGAVYGDTSLGILMNPVEEQALLRFPDAAARAIGNKTLIANGPHLPAEAALFKADQSVGHAFGAIAETMRGVLTSIQQEQALLARTNALSRLPYHVRTPRIEMKMLVTGAVESFANMQAVAGRHLGWNQADINGAWSGMMHRLTQVGSANDRLDYWRQMNSVAQTYAAQRAHLFSNRIKIAERRAARD